MTVALSFDLTPFDLLQLCCQMRPDEIRQHLAVTGAPDYDADAAATYFHGLPGVKCVIRDVRGDPLAAGGYQPIANGVWQSWMVGTVAAWDMHWRTITKHTRQLMQYMFAEHGARRLQTTCFDDRRAAMCWFQRGLRMRLEGVLREFGPQGQGVAIFGRTQTDEVNERGH